VLFDTKGNIKFISQYEFKQYFPKNGWVEHNPNEIWSTTLKALKQVIKRAKSLKGHILTIGITNQRETTILWNKKTGKPIYNAIVWQDRRTQEYCKSLKNKNFENTFRKKTGLFIDPYFSATKIKWILDNVKVSKQLLKSNNLLFGTVDTFLIWKLTKGKQHLTEATNASRTMLFNINNNKWDKEILEKLKIPKNILPDVKNSADNFGKTDKRVMGKEIPISAVLGDQQAAAVGQACFEKGSIKSTYGTGAFIIMNTGSKKINSKNKLLTTICYRLNNKTTYALEGSIFIAGAGVQWLRDKIKLINNAYETEIIAKSTKSNKEVYVVPAFSGIGAPYWRPDARGLITGLTRDSDWKTLVRATVESVAYQSHDLFYSMNKDGLKPRILKIDGGMVANNWFAQFLADVINLKVIRPKVLETTALGAALFAGYQVGEFKSLNQIKNTWKKDKAFKPKINKKLRNHILHGWKQAIKKTLA
jgi:glycerol kinase